MNKITNDQINEIAESMPGYPDEFNWREFARKLLGLQEQTILDMQVEIAKVKKSRKKWRNRAIANLADAMQKATSDAVESLNKMASKMDGDFVKVDAGEEKQEQAAQTLTHNGKTYKRGVWIEWNGGYDAPVPNGVKHCVMFRSNTLSGISKDASNRYWNHDNDSSDIVSFMIL